MVEEYNSIMINDVWEVMPRLVDRLVVGSQLICKIKYAVDAARFMAKGYALKEGINYEENFALVSIYTSISIMISLET